MMKNVYLDQAYQNGIKDSKKGSEGENVAAFFGD
jgi:hypothetical protein